MKKLITYLQVLWPHFLAVAIFCGAFAFVVFVEPWAFPRLLASFVLLVQRFFSFVTLFFGRKPSSPYLLSYVTSMGELPSWIASPDPKAFFSGLLVYFRLLFTKGQAMMFLSDGSSFLFFVVRLLMLLAVAYLTFRLWYGSYFEESGLPWFASSRELVRFKAGLAFVGNALKRVFGYLGWLFRSFWALPLVLFLLYGLNAYSYSLDFVGLFFYFFASMDFLSLVDFVLSTLTSFFFSLSFLPVWLLLVFGYVAFRWLCFRHADRFISQRLIPACQAFLKKLTGVFTLIVGKMRGGKTELMTLFAIFQSLNDREAAFAIMRKFSTMFSDFPWQAFENWILYLSTSRHLRGRRIFNIIQAQFYASKLYSLIKSGKFLSFRYDLSTQRTVFYDGCKNVTLLYAMKAYAQAFYLYARYDTFIASNFSIRTDEICMDRGHLFLWNDDLFDRDNRDLLGFSTFSHILKFDSLRLGLRVNPEDPFNLSAGPGIYAITEEDKERGNRDSNASSKVSDDVANPKNDFFGYSIKLGGHIASIDNVNFFKIFGDMQYTGALSLTDVSVAQNIFTVDRKNVSERNAVPFWWIEPIILEKVISFCDGFYKKYRFSREDSTLLSWLVSKASQFSYFVTSFVRNRYGYDKIGLVTATCTSSGDLQEGEKVDFYAPYFLAFSDRYQSNCMSGFLNDGKNLAVCGFTDLPKFSGVENTKEEWEAQGSYLVSDLSAGKKTSVSQNASMAKARISLAPNKASRPVRAGKGRADVLKGGSSRE